MQYLSVFVERRPTMLGVVSIIAVYDKDGNDITNKLATFATNKGLDLHGAHHFGESDEQFTSSIQDFLEKILGAPVSVEIS